MSTFIYRDEYSVSGLEYDNGSSGASGFEGYERLMVEFLRVFLDGTWDTVCLHVPFPLGHERCTSEDLVRWFRETQPQMNDMVYVGVYHRS
jgi:hypothetical protein